jgi:probable selenium-dependent hydroxylase accessory protein YqeC|nr:selenium cofactor biosynthesis protein YqeC [Candidatus Krumholzibacteria bacterium]
MNFSFLDPWHVFLPREGGHVISIMGSGGKTSLQRALAEVLRQDRVPVVLTTTTRTEAWSEVPVFDLADLVELEAQAMPLVFYLRDGVDSQGKWRGLAPGDVDRLDEVFPDRVFLVEVDGSAKLPLKIHRPGEPVWPARTSLAMVAMGAGATGGFLHDHVHRLGRQPSVVLDPLPVGSMLEWEHLLGMLVEKGGYLEQVPEQVPVILALMGMAEVDDSIGLFDFVGKAMMHPRLPITLFCETGGESPSFRAGCRVDSGDQAEEKDGQQDA